MIKTLNWATIIICVNEHLFKQAVQKTVLANITEKIAGLQQQLLELSISAANETKSTAGDKFETALAMLQTEQANNRRQLQTLLEQKAVLENIAPRQVYETVCPGCIMQAADVFFYFSIASAKMVIDGHTVLPVSIASPLARVLAGKCRGAEIVFSNKKYIIKKIF